MYSGSVEPRLGSIGTLVGVNSPNLTEMISSLGFDFLFLDLEHGEIPAHRIADHVRASRVPILARLADCSETAVRVAADAGVHGLIAPHVKTARQARDIVDWACYPPVGRRSVGLARNSLLGTDLAASLAVTDRPIVVAQIEDEEAIADIHGIAATAGLGGLFVGPFDLSASVSVPGDFTSPGFRSALESVASAAGKQSISAGIYAPTVATWMSFKDLGFQYVVLRADSLFLLDGARALLAEIGAGGQ
jgi:2-keto-3-deoxy-L-rhamnonate aldolase RhmA